MDGFASKVSRDRIHGSVTRVLLASLLLGAAAFIVYWPVTGYEFVNYDDAEYIVHNPQVTSGLTWEGFAWAIRTTRSSNWHPLTWLSHMLDVELFGQGAGGPHMTNLFFHAANSLLLFLLLRQLTGALWRSAFVAALFALHPLHVESVAWISERKDVLSTFFGLLTLLCYGHYAGRSPSSTGLRALTSTHYWLALLFFALGLMSKPMLVTLPFILLLLDWWPLCRIPDLGLRVAIWRRLFAEKIPFFLLSAASCVVTIIAQRMAVQTFDQISTEIRAVNAVVSYVRYLGKMLWPANLAILYPHPGYWPVWLFCFCSVFLLVVSLTAVRFGRKLPFLPVGWFWYVGMLFPVIGLVQVGMQSMADRYAYLPLVGVFIALVWILDEAATRWRLPQRILWTGALLILAACAGAARLQLSYWQNTETLFRHAIAVTENNYIAYVNLGTYAGDNGQLNEAKENYRKALEISPNGPEALCSLGAILQRQGYADEAMAIYEKALEANPANYEAVGNLGLVLAEKKQYDKAIDHFKAAVQVRPDSVAFRLHLSSVLTKVGKFDDAIVQLREALRYEPDHAQVFESLGQIFALKQDYGEAIRQYEGALRLAPNNARVMNSLGLALAAQGRVAQAIEQYKAALRADPKLIEVYNNLGSALVSAGNLDEAIRQFRLLLQWMPDHCRAHDNLGIALAMKGDLDAAVVEFQEAVRCNPGYANTHFNLGNVLALQRRFDEAIVQYEETLRLSPNHVQAHCHLGGALAERGRREEAIKHLNEALRLQPDYPKAKEQLQALGVKTLE